MSQQWEYCELYPRTEYVPGPLLSSEPDTGYYKGTGRGVVFWVPADMIQKDAPDTEMPVGRLGAAGWELVSVETKPAVAGGYRYFFKRPVEPGRRIDDAF
jgi:hypothetical protein